MVGLWPSSSLSTGCVVSLRGDWAIFCHAGSGRVGRVWSAREKSLKILFHGCLMIIVSQILFRILEVLWYVLRSLCGWILDKARMFRCMACRSWICAVRFSSYWDSIRDYLDESANRFMPENVRNTNIDRTSKLGAYNKSRMHCLFHAVEYITIQTVYRLIINLYICFHQWHMT